MPPKQMSMPRSVLQASSGWGAGLGRFRQGFSPGFCLLSFNIHLDSTARGGRSLLLQGRLRMRKAGRPRMKISKVGWNGQLSTNRVRGDWVNTASPPEHPLGPALGYYMEETERVFHIQETFLDFPEGRPLPGSHALVHCLAGTVAQ